MSQFITKLINIFFFPFTKLFEWVKILLKRRSLRRRAKGVIYTMTLTKGDVTELNENINGDGLEGGYQWIKMKALHLTPDLKS